MTTWWNPFTWGKAPQPAAEATRLQGLPVAVNPAPPQTLLRAASRLTNLAAAAEAGDTRAEVAAEIARYQALIASFGHPLPRTAAEAQALLDKLKG